jgi:hypothetical protein
LQIGLFLGDAMGIDVDFSLIFDAAKDMIDLVRDSFAGDIIDIGIILFTITFSIAGLYTVAAQGKSE